MLGENFPYCCGILKHPTAHIFSFAILVSLAAALNYLMVHAPNYFYFSAIVSTIIVLSVKLVALFVHGPELKKLSTRTTSSESRYESSPQLILVLAICFKSGNFTLYSASSLLSSILMIGKSGAQSHLTFGSENLIEKTGRGWRGLLKKPYILKAKKNWQSQLSSPKKWCKKCVNRVIGVY